MGTPLSYPLGSSETLSAAAHSFPGILGHIVPRLSPYRTIEKKNRVEMSLISNVQCLTHWGLIKKCSIKYKLVIASDVSHKAGPQL